MKIRITQADIDKGQKAFNGTPGRSRVCPLAQALQRRFDGPAVVGMTTAMVGGRTFYLQMDAMDFVVAADHERPLTPTTVTLEPHR